MKSGSLPRTYAGRDHHGPTLREVPTDGARLTHDSPARSFPQIVVDLADTD